MYCKSQRINKTLIIFLLYLLTLAICLCLTISVDIKFTLQNLEFVTHQVFVSIYVNSLGTHLMFQLMYCNV